MSDSGRSGGGGRGGGGGGTGISLLCRNLPVEIGADEVRDAFAKYGEIRDVYLPKDHYTQRAKGFGFIEFADARDADEAVRDLDGSSIGGRTVSVVHSKQSRKTPRDMARRDEVAPRYPPRREERRRDDRDFDRERSRRSDRDSRRDYRPPASRSRSPRRRRHGSRDRGSSRSPGRGRSPVPRRVSPVPRRQTYSREASPPLPRRSLPRRHSRSPVPRRRSRSRSKGRGRGSGHSGSLPLSHSRSPVLRRSRDASRSASPLLRRSPDVQHSPDHRDERSGGVAADLPSAGGDTAVAV